MATRPCMTSASRKRFTPFSSMSLVKPRGSKKPSGEMAPGSPKQGSFGLGTQPLMGSTVGTKGDASTAGAAFTSVAVSMRRAVEETPVEAGGAKAAAEPARAARMASFILMLWCGGKLVF